MARADSRTRPSDKGERTKARILATALRMFQEHGFEATTMRRVAQAAGVSLGSAYYYFESKEHLIQGFYALTHVEHLAACEALLASEKDLRRRLEGVLLAKLASAEPYHRISGILFKTAADPHSPLSPFSPASQVVREEGIDLMRRVIEGSDTKLAADLRDKLPELLWLHMLSVILFWIHDESPGRARTRRLIARTVELVTRLVGLASLPLMGPLRSSALELLDELKADATPRAD